MRKNYGKQSWAFPMPALVVATYNPDGTANAMTAAWGGIHDTNQIGICLSAEHKTVDNLRARGAFTVSFATEKTAVGADYVGIVSGKNAADKVARAGWHVVPATAVDAPLIEEFPVTLECRLVSYDENSGYTVADIVNVSADESVLDESGRIDCAKFKPVVFDPVAATYRSVGDIVCRAFSVGNALKK